jgi:hypothetical protein
VTDKKIDVVEIYPKIFVYKNLFKNIEETFLNLQDSSGLFSEWTKWLDFGEYLNPLFKEFPYQMSLDSIKKIETKTEKQKKDKSIIIELLENFNIATEDYILKNNINFNKNKTVLTKNNENVLEWVVSGPSIARYKKNIDRPIAMIYHSDYIREPILSPGYKFAITALAYFNDDYEGGEIDFIVNGEAYMYKPEAGDFLVFPSGHPDILTNNNSVYIHGVMPSKNSQKYISRMYWMKYEVGSDEWFEKEKEFGKEVWKEMQEEIMQKFKHDNPNKVSAKNERRIK